MVNRIVRRSGRNSGKTSLAPWQKKAILSQLGAEPSDSIKECDILLEAARREDLEGYEAAFNLIVHGKLPDAAPPEKINTKMIVDAINDYEAQAIEGVQQVAEAEVMRIAAVITKHAKERIDEESKKFNTVEYVVTSKAGAKVKVEGPLPECFQNILELADERVNILLVGPAGCGKTHTAMEVAKALKLDFAGQSCSAGMSESIFSGWLLPIEKGGQFVYVSSEFVRVYENGGVFLFDEIDASDSNTLLFLNQALANGSFYLPQRFNNPKVTKHKDFVAIAAANTYGTGATAMYSGRNTLDAATMDRFRMGVVSMDYSAVVEEALIEAEVLRWGRAVRDVIKQKNLRKIMSTRLLLEASKMRRNKNWSIRQISEAYFCDWSPEERHIIESNVSYRAKIEIED